MKTLLARLGTILIGKVRQENTPLAGFCKSFLYWFIIFLFVWEIVGRLIVIPLFYPHSQAALPESMLDQLMALLPQLLGL